MSQTRYYRPEKVAALAHCTIQTIYRHLQSDKFPNARRIGDRKWIIPEPDVIDYLGYDPTVEDAVIL